MKTLLIVLCGLYFIILTGCQDNYLIKNYNSPKEFYKVVNKETDGHSVEVLLNSGKEYETDTLVITEDSIIISLPYTYNEEGGNAVLPNDSIKSIVYNYFDYSGNRGNSAVITLKNGNKIDAENVIGRNDSLLFSIQSQSVQQIYHLTFPIDEVKKISYNDHLTGLAHGIGTGILAGTLAGIQIGSTYHDEPMGGGQEPFFAYLAGSVLGCLGGGIVGVALGSDQQFIFKDDKPTTGFTSFGIIGGMNAAYVLSSIDYQHEYDNLGIDEFSYGIFGVWSFNENIGLRSEIIYGITGGNYVKPSGIYNNRTIYLNYLKIPITFQYSIPTGSINPRIYAGPEITHYFGGRLDVGTDDPLEYYPFRFPYHKDINSSQLNNPNFGLLFGLGINLERHITFDFQYDFGLRKFNSNLFDIETPDLRQNQYTFMMGYEF